MSSREQFETWLSSEYQWANDALNEAHFHGDDATGYYTGGDFIYDGRSCSDALFWAWRGWQESHQQGEAKCAALAAELKQSQIDAGCYKKGMEASNERLVQVAAENAGLKALCEDRRTFIMNGVQLGYIKVPTVETDPALETIRVAVSPHGSTPATDSFLAEVRAQGVDAAIEAAKNVVAQEFQYKDFETAQRVCSKFPESDLVGKVEMVEWLADFAAQLRKGASA
ncbi:hypothetical protein [Escherichia coli]|uniref:hypothetical protein n=1 Tax=Escherichia coli TaxID=562 RepID=UPI003F5759A9